MGHAIPRGYDAACLSGFISGSWKNHRPVEESHTYRRITGRLKNHRPLWHTCQKAFQDMLRGSEGSFMSETGRGGNWPERVRVPGFFTGKSHKAADRKTGLCRCKYTNEMLLSYIKIYDMHKNKRIFKKDRRILYVFLLYTLL